ncbi:MAG TPA: rhodanese-like domain-containing protein, partial [Gammaproteobacteria bacterium]|nr:rhodanese-like domain-containing protein [Gammaproteobacteria bacterium]
QLFDVRTEAEFVQGAVPGARNVPVQYLKAKAGNLDSNKPVIVYCRTGGRSAKAQRLLEGIGFRQVHNAGGIDSYLSD